MIPIFPKTRELLQANGIDPLAVLLDSIDRDGYTEILLDNEGVQVAGEDGKIITTSREWPEPGFGLKVMNCMIEELQGRPRPQVKVSTETVDQTVLLRRRYDLDPSQATAQVWLDAENQLNPTDFDAYMALYRRVSETTENKE